MTGGGVAGGGVGGGGVGLGGGDGPGGLGVAPGGGGVGFWVAKWVRLPPGQHMVPSALPTHLPCNPTIHTAWLK